MCFAHKNVNRVVLICTSYVLLFTVLLIKCKIKTLLTVQQWRPFTNTILFERQTRFIKQFNSTSSKMTKKQTGFELPGFSATLITTNNIVCESMVFFFQ